MSTRVPRDPATRTAKDGEASPRLPHEHDESADSGRSEPREVIRRAQRDLEAGRVDTTRGAETDAAYRKQKDPPRRHNRGS